MAVQQQEEPTARSAHIENLELQLGDAVSTIFAQLLTRIENATNTAMRKLELAHADLLESLRDDSSGSRPYKRSARPGHVAGFKM